MKSWNEDMVEWVFDSRKSIFLEIIVDNQNHFVNFDKSIVGNTAAVLVRGLAFSAAIDSIQFVLLN